jgi:hypothetical protein
MVEIAMGNAESSVPPCWGNDAPAPQHAFVEVTEGTNAAIPSEDMETSRHAAPPSANGDASRRSRSRKFGLHRKVAQAFKQWIQNLEEFMFPKGLLVVGSQQQEHRSNASTSKQPPSTTSGTLLYGCKSLEEQYQRIQELIQLCQQLHGEEGLRALGFEYRMIPCDEHKCFAVESVDDDEDHGGVLNIESTVPLNYNDDDENDEVCSNYGGSDEGMERKVVIEEPSESKVQSFASRQFSDSVLSNHGSCTSHSHMLASQNADIWTTPSLTATSAVLDLEEPTALGSAPVSCNAGPPTNRFCHLCFRRLYHVASDTPIVVENRKEFIADGDMYELTCRFIQEYAHEVMMQEGNLRWVTVADDARAPIRVLVSAQHPFVSSSTTKQHDDRPTVLICTGRGKVRAGIFSRQNLLCTGLEMSTAIPMVRDAVQRGLHVILADPNVHGEQLGFVTFSRTMDFFEPHYATSHRRDLYVVSHSASGGHMARYFLDKSESAYLRNIRAIAFTDSTHSIQWAKAPQQRYLYDLLQSAQCIYFRCSSSARDTISGDGTKWYLHPSGELVQTDSFWKHRFGSIRTVWAGTNEHSMTNWFSHAKIWEHFDYFLHGASQQ